MLKYWTTVVENITEWQELLNKEIPKCELRQNYILCLNVTIAAFGRLGSYFYNCDKTNMEKFMRKLKKADWSRNNVNDWGGRVIGDYGKVLTNETAVILICNKMKQLIGIPLTEEEMVKENTLIRK